jgi:Tol biopolymer transport system component
MYKSSSEEDSPDSSLKLYLELYRVPTDGSTNPVKVNDTFVSDSGVETFRISPDSRWVVYKVAIDDAWRQLYSVPIDGSSTPIKIASSMFIVDERISPNSSWVAFRTDSPIGDLVGGLGDLYRVPIDERTYGSNRSLLLCPGNVSSFQISSDSSHILCDVDLPDPTQWVWWQCTSNNLHKWSFA